MNLFRNVAVLITTLGLAAQVVAGQRSEGSDSRVAGVVVSKIDGRPLDRARVTLRSVRESQKFEFRITGEDGKFSFENVPRGKYSLEGAKRGFISAGYDQHDQFSSAIVTGAGLETQNLMLKLAPAGLIFGKVLDEAGEPVRHAGVVLYHDDHLSGVDRVVRSHNAQTDDLGQYEMTPLMPGTYFLSVSAQPWYVIRALPERSDTGSPATAKVDRSLDVAYPVTFYPDVTDADSATPIPIRGGERLQIDIHLNPVPALRLVFHVPKNSGTESMFPTIEQPTFDDSGSVVPNSSYIPSTGAVEVQGVPAGHYNIRLQGPGTSLRMNGVDLLKDGEEIDASAAEPSSKVKISARIPGETSFPTGFLVGLRGKGRVPAGAHQLDDKGQAEIDDVPAGRYEILIWGQRKPFSIARISAEGADVTGHTISLSAGTPASVSLTLVAGSMEVQGTVKGKGKPFAGAMVVLVPKQLDGNRDLFRRDQSDLDGTFSLHNVVPGSYTLLAIKDGWDLDWSQPAVIAAYAKHGRTIEVRNTLPNLLTVPDAIELISK